MGKQSCNKNGAGRIVGYRNRSSFLVYYRDALMHLRQRIILERYHALYFDNRDQIMVWPDMIPAFRTKSWVDSGELKKISDPTDNHTLTDSIDKKIVFPISEDWVHRPPNRTKTPWYVSSVILYGPPGIKTSLAKIVAKALKWPLLVLTSTNFLFRGGLESVERSKAEIFDDLLRLRRVVVLFDELEDFVRARAPNKELKAEPKVLLSLQACLFLCKN